MAFIKLKNEKLPGIIGLCNYRPEFGDKLIALVDEVMTGTNTLSRGERELIAAYTSYFNGSKYCVLSHASNAAESLDTEQDIVNEIRENFPNLSISDKMRALLDLAKIVGEGTDVLSQNDVDEAKNKGVSEQEIHDTVFIASLMYMSNRYVVNLGVASPEEGSSFYKMNALNIVKHGYKR